MSFKPYHLWVLMDKAMPRQDLVAKGFYDAFLTKMRNAGYITPVEQERCVTCGSLRSPMLYEWSGPPPTLELRSVGKINAARVAEIAQLWNTFIRKRDKIYEVKIHTSHKAPRGGWRRIHQHEAHDDDIMRIAKALSDV